MSRQRRRATYDEVAATRIMSRSDRKGVRFEVEAAYSRYRLWNRQVAGVALGQGHHTAYSRVGTIRTNGRHVRSHCLRLRRRARCLYLSERSSFEDLGNGP